MFKNIKSKWGTKSKAPNSLPQGQTKYRLGWVTTKEIKQL